MIDHTCAICAYGKSQFLEECILSIKKQSIPAKIIITSSTPNAHIFDLAKKYALEVFTHKETGIGKDWNFGYACAKTKYLTLVHQDDVYAKDYLEIMKKEMDKKKEALIGFCDYREIRDGEIVRRNANLKIKESLLLPIYLFGDKKIIKRRVLSLGNPICCPTVTYNKENLPAFKFNTELNTNLDWEAWEELSRKKGSFVYIKKPLLCHRIHEESETSNTIKNSKRAKEDLMMIQKFWPKALAGFIYKFYSKSENRNRLS